MTDTVPHSTGAARSSPTPYGVGAAPLSRALPPPMVLLFLASMVMPVWINVGSILLMPHRIILLLAFIPLLGQLLAGRAGQIGVFDCFMAFSAAWAVIAIGLNENFHGRSNIQPMGIYVLESLGAYLLGRVAIRNRDDFVAFVRLFFWALMVLVPFAIVEAITHRAVMLEMIPQSVDVVNTAPRWGLRRAQTVFGHPILFGVFAGIGFGLFLYILRSNVTRISGALLSAAGTFFSLSTGALIMIVMQSILIAWEWSMKSVNKRWTIFAILFAFMYAAIDLLSNRTPFHVLITYATFNTGSSYNRILIWRFGMENVWMNPWFGLGENVQTWVRPQYMSSSADNFWLLMAMKFGIPSFLAMAAALFIIIRRISFAPLADPLAQACRAGYLTSLGGVIIAGGTVHFWHGVMAFVMFLFGAGVWMINTGTEDAARLDAPQGDGRDIGDAPPQDALVYTRQTPCHVRRPKASAPPPIRGRLERAQQKRRGRG